MYDLNLKTFIFSLNNRLSSLDEKFYKKNFDIYVDLDCTSPIRNVEDIDKAIEK